MLILDLQIFLWNVAQHILSFRGKGQLARIPWKLKVVSKMQPVPCIIKFILHIAQYILTTISNNVYYFY